MEAIHWKFGANGTSSSLYVGTVCLLLYLETTAKL